MSGRNTRSTRSQNNQAGINDLADAAAVAAGAEDAAVAAEPVAVAVAVAEAEAEEAEADAEEAPLEHGEAVADAVIMEEAGLQFNALEDAGGPTQLNLEWSTIDAFLCAPDRLPHFIFPTIMYKDGYRSDGTDWNYLNGVGISSGIHEIDPSTLDSDEQETWLSNGKPAFHQVIQQTIQYLRPFQIMACNRSDIKVLTKAAKLDGIKDYKTYTGHSIYAPTLNKGKSFFLYCSRCMRMSAETPHLSDIRYCEVLQGRWRHTSWSIDDPLRPGTIAHEVHLEVENLYFHNRNCTPENPVTYPFLVGQCLGTQYSNNPLHGVHGETFFFDHIFEHTYDPVVEFCNHFQDPQIANPPGTNINFGHPEGYTFDDRRNCYLPSESYHACLSNEDHQRALVRFVYYWVNLNDLMYQFTDKFPTRQLPHLPTPPDGSAYGGMFSVKYASLITGGHNIDQTDSGRARWTPQGQSNQPVVHQLCHCDFPHHEFTEPVDDSTTDTEVVLYGATANPNCANHIKSGSILIPLDDMREVYLIDEESIAPINKGEYLYFPGDLPHGGLTYKWVMGDVPQWHPCMHIYVENVNHALKFNQLAFAATPHTYLPVEHIRLLDQTRRNQIKQLTVPWLESLMDTEEEEDRSQTLEEVRQMLEKFDISKRHKKKKTR